MLRTRNFERRPRRLTVREALRTLETQGFIQIKKGSGGGAFIGNTDPGILPSIIMDNLLPDGLTSEMMTEARTTLECAIVKSAIEHGTEEDLDRISRHIELSQPITDPERTELLLRERIQFHILVAEASHNLPFILFLRTLMAWAMRGVSPPEEVEKWQEKFMFHPSGTGPLRVVEIKPKEKIVLERIEDYWGPRPYGDRVILKFIRSADARLIALQKGKIDITQLFDEARPTLDKDPNMQYEVVVSYSTLHKQYFNVRRWPMRDVRFRKAMWKDAACIPIFFWRMLIAWDKKLKGVVNHPDGAIYVTNAWANMWIEK